MTIPSVAQKGRVEKQRGKKERERERDRKRYVYELLPRVRLVSAAFDNSPMGLWMHERFDG